MDGLLLSVILGCVAKKEQTNKKNRDEAKNQIRWKSDIHLISKCKFKSPSYHPRIEHLFKLCDALLVDSQQEHRGGYTAAVEEEKKWVSNLLAATRDSLQWWILYIIALSSPSP